VILPTWLGPQYSSAPLARRHRPPPARPYAEYRPCVRSEFKRTCVYCLCTEPEVAPGADYGGFEVEHFRPKADPCFKRFRNVYLNLFWACPACNRAKGDVWPTDAELARGERFVDPCGESLGAHLRLSAERVEAVAGSKAADFMIIEINLNSALHVERRKERDRRARAFATLEASYLVMVESLRGAEVSVAQEAALAGMRAALDDVRPACLPVSESGPGGCLCTGHPTDGRKRLSRRERRNQREASSKRSH
jgi:hypothetical protein